MLVGLCGGICAGKHSVAISLIEKHAFQPISLLRTVSTPAVEKSASDARLPESPPISSVHTFPNVDELLDFVTKRWQERWVMTDIWDEKDLDALLRRPFFILVSVEAPVSVRWQRFKARCLAHSLAPPTLEQFVLRSDEHLYSPETGLAKLLDRAQVRLLNPSASIKTLHAALENLDLADEKRLRPTWDQYFMQLASLAAQRSNCMKRRVGCVLVRERRVISTGYNGTPRGLQNCNEGGCPRCNGGQSAGVALSTCLCIHAEENALLEAGRERIREGSTLYCDTCPCLTCSIKIAQVGINEVVYSQGYYMDTETAAVFREAGVQLRQFSPPRHGLVELT
ncbi:hypothetical protein EV356DRAFT_522601 [Viridothelium virens]|uniref:Deoxycytidylate deaminase n=1 Tax=Viridothelium virens TaxID=1048519 RepID=A0A6A6HER9_VIRVR|nr:hypothetical protein EV356DRAFT_522601 [Viridothelium virens]